MKQHEDWINRRLRKINESSTLEKVSSTINKLQIYPCGYLFFYSFLKLYNKKDEWFIYSLIPLKKGEVLYLYNKGICYKLKIVDFNLNQKYSIYKVLLIEKNKHDLNNIELRDVFFKNINKLINQCDIFYKKIFNLLELSTQSQINLLSMEEYNIEDYNKKIEEKKRLILNRRK